MRWVSSDVEIPLRFVRLDACNRVNGLVFASWINSFLRCLPIADSITQGLQTSNSLTGNNYSLGLQNSSLGFGNNSLGTIGSPSIGNLGGGKCLKTRLPTSLLNCSLWHCFSFAIANCPTIHQNLHCLGIRIFILSTFGCLFFSPRLFNS